ncbi:MAG: hypothetical protein ABJA98_18805 [Acidobacteriota bacterium]
MPFVPALLRALVTLDGEAIVLHPGDRPYIVSPRGPVELSSRALTTAALTALLVELLPPDTLAVLETSGSVQWERPASAEPSGDRFVVVAARVNREPWVEVRRYPNAPPRGGAPQKPRVPDEDGLRVPSADEFWPARAEKDIDDTF